MGSDRAILAESVDLENQADFYAINCQFGPASQLMREANKLRQRVFGKIADPNELRDRTSAILDAAPGVGR